MRRLFGYLLVIGLPVLGAAYMAEIYLWYLGAKSLGVITQKSDHTYDPRSKLELVADLRKAGKKTSLYVSPETLFRAQGKNLGSALKGKDGKDLLSLCGVSKSLNVVCNESGSFPIMSLTGMALTIPTRYGVLVEPISSHSVALLRLVTACRAEKA